jgi:glycosyltransferase involved in cell wall biosynthesis
MISVVMITYGHENYIKDAIEGVFIQKCNFPIELIISNDCSPDSTHDIISHILANDPRSQIIRYINRVDNLGMMPNFIDTLSLSRGKYIALCEGDDYWTDPFKLQKQVDFLDNNVDFSGSSHQSTIIKNGINIGFFSSDCPEVIGVEDLLGKRLFHTASIVFRSNVLPSIVKAPPVLSGDRLVNFCVAFLGKIHFFNDDMCVYRLNYGGMSTVANAKQQRLDLSSINYFKSIYPSFPGIKYRSYIYASIGLNTNGSVLYRIYYILLSIIFSFSYFPQNVKDILKYLRKTNS